jgi:hypothetical protein
MIKSTTQMKRATNKPHVSIVLICLLHVFISSCIEFAAVTYDDDDDDDTNWISRIESYATGNTDFARSA